MKNKRENSKRRTTQKSATSEKPAFDAPAAPFECCFSTGKNENGPGFVQMNFTQ